MFTYTVDITTQQQHRKLSSVKCLKVCSHLAMQLFHNVDEYIVQKLMLNFCIMFNLYCTFQLLHCNGCVKALATVSNTKCQNV